MSEHQKKDKSETARSSIKKSVEGSENVRTKMVAINDDDNEGIVLPLIAVRNTVLFPMTLTPLFIGRDKSLNALYYASANSVKVFVTAQINSSDEVDPMKLYKTGVIANILHVSKSSDSSARVLLDSIKKGYMVDYYLETGSDGEKDKAFYMARIKEIEIDDVENTAELDALKSSILKAFTELGDLSGKSNDESLSSIQQVSNISSFANTVASVLPIDTKKKQKLLEEDKVKNVLMEGYKHLIYEIESLKSEKDIQEKVKSKISKYQKEYYLNEQMKVLNDEIKRLNPDNDNSDHGKYTKMLKQVKLPEEVKQKADEELKKLSGGGHPSDLAIVKSYLDFILALPWTKKTKANTDIKTAENILNEHHSGLGKIKERVLEYVAVQSRLEKPRGSILCLYGPPGVGKTSLVKSIAQAMGKEYVKISLGGLRDESEIRGHRRTYVGAFAGKILLALKKAKVTNPVILLDEIDKLGMSYRGDPYSALLEVLDPEQNKDFQDHYLEVGYDLSNVTFIATANSLEMPRPLIDRMEILRLSGYSDIEKIEIAKKHLIKEVLEENGLEGGILEISDEILSEVIRSYTRESGVRQLRREIGRICRKVVKKISEDATQTQFIITLENLKEYLGIKAYKHGEKNDKNEVGVVTGLAYTEAGGDILAIETIKTSGGKGEVKMTGKLGDVMKESVQAAFGYMQANALRYGIDAEELKNNNVHLHVPEGATPKDGPSAGIAITTALISLFVNKPIRHDIAMTGEVTLRGKVLPIGGLKEKLMSAVRSGIKEVFIPLENEKDLEDIPQEIKSCLIVNPISDVNEVLQKAILW